MDIDQERFDYFLSYLRVYYSFFIVLWGLVLFLALRYFVAYKEKIKICEDNEAVYACFTLSVFAIIIVFILASLAAGRLLEVFFFPDLLKGEFLRKNGT